MDQPKVDRLLLIMKILAYRFLILVVVLSAFNQFTFSQVKSCSFYIVAHQDDWQFFMGSDAWKEMEMTDRKVVFIYLTAGDACNGTGYCDYQVPYFVSRENGTKNSVYLVTDNVSSPPAGFGRPANSPVSVNGHTIAKWQYKNVVQYFLRLPDGRVHFDNSSHYQCGFDPGDSTFINNFRRGILRKLFDITGTTVYSGWSDLAETVGTILTTEKTGQTAWIHTHDFSPAFNPATHPDHRETGLLVEDICNLFPGFNVAYYIDYSTHDRDINLSSDEIMKETGLFAAYNAGKINGGCPTDWNSNDLQWCSRNYVSRNIFYSGTSHEPAGKTGFVLEVYPNPSGFNSTVSIVVPTAESVSCSVFDISGKLLRILVDNQLLTTGKYSYPLAKLPRGVYFLKMWTLSGFNLEEKIVFN